MRLSCVDEHVHLSEVVPWGVGVERAILESEKWG